MGLDEVEGSAAGAEWCAWIVAGGAAALFPNVWTVGALGVVLLTGAGWRIWRTARAGAVRPREDGESS